MPIGLIAPLLLALASPAAGGDPAARCQRAIELGAMRHTTKLLDSIERCAKSAAPSLTACIASDAERRGRDRARVRWGEKAAQACAGVAFVTELGYLDTCSPPPSSCVFPTTAIDTTGPANDLLDCLACLVEERLGGVGALLFVNRGVEGTCHEMVGRPGLHILRVLIARIEHCLRKGKAESIAACLGDPAITARETSLLGDWRVSAKSACADVDVFQQLGYPMLCAGVIPNPPPACGARSPACDFPATSTLAIPGADNDLMDCLQCQVEEAALGVGRAVYGAELCCTADGCRTIRTRAACRRVRGAPAHYRVDSIDVGGVSGPHGVAVGPDGTIYTPDHGAFRVTKRDPTGAVTVLGSTPGAPFGLGVDASGNVYVALRRDRRVIRFAPDGSSTPFAGTGAVGYSGDGGPAVDAAITAPNGIAVDRQGNVYITESGVISATLYGVGGVTDEHIRVVDATGIIHTFAGLGLYTQRGLGGPALAAGLGAPYELWANDDGSLLIGEVGLNRVLRVDPDGIMRLVAGKSRFTFDGIGAYSGDGGPAVNARLYGAEGVGMDHEGKVFIADMRNSRIRLVDEAGSIITIAGTSEGSDGPPPPDGTLAVLASAGCPGGLAMGPDDRPYYADISTGRVRVLTVAPFTAEPRN